MRNCIFVHNRHICRKLLDYSIRSGIFTDFSYSTLYAGKLYVQLLEMLTFYAGFEINEQTGEALTDHEMTDIHYNRITSLQKAAFKHFPELHNFALANVASIGMLNPVSKLLLESVCTFVDPDISVKLRLHFRDQHKQI